VLTDLFKNKRQIQVLTDLLKNREQTQVVQKGNGSSPINVTNEVKRTRDYDNAKRSQDISEKDTV
jgi:hypothetical protein